MIVFTQAPIVAGAIYAKFNQPIMIFNLSSLYSGYEDITDLISKLELINNTGMPMPEFVDSVQFDMQLANSVINDNNLFVLLMKIMMYCTEGYNVIILVERDSYRDAVMESLIKLIQQRYGYNAWIVEDPEDVECLQESHFTPGGIMTLDKDIERYVEMVNNGVVLPILPMINVE